VGVLPGFVLEVAQMRSRRTTLAVVALAGALALTGCSSKGSADARSTPTPSATSSLSDPQQPDVYRSTEPISNKNYPFLIQAIPGVPDGTIVVRTDGGNLASLILQAEKLPGVTSVDRKDTELRLKTDGPTWDTLVSDVKAMEKADGVKQVVVVIAYADPSLTPMP
jgi:ABC-type oligopeptide transport system substrate-binding subunit